MLWCDGCGYDLCEDCGECISMDCEFSKSCTVTNETKENNVSSD